MAETARRPALDRVGAFLAALPLTAQPRLYVVATARRPGAAAAPLFRHDLRQVHAIAAAGITAPAHMPLPGVTRGQVQVIELLARGMETPEIAAELHIAVMTIKSRLGRAFAAFGATGRAHLVAEAIRRGYLALSDDGRRWEAVWIEPAQTAAPTMIAGTDRVPAAAVPDADARAAAALAELARVRAVLDEVLGQIGADRYVTTPKAKAYLAGRAALERPSITEPAAASSALKGEGK